MTKKSHFRKAKLDKLLETGFCKVEGRCITWDNDLNLGAILLGLSDFEIEYFQFLKEHRIRETFKVTVDTTIPRLTDYQTLVIKPNLEHTNLYIRTFAAIEVELDLLYTNLSDAEVDYVGLMQKGDRMSDSRSWAAEKEDEIVTCKYGRTHKFFDTCECEGCKADRDRSQLISAIAKSIGSEARAKASSLLELLPEEEWKKVKTIKVKFGEHIK